jgi:L-cysteine S-thiosulfotransferase
VTTSLFAVRGGLGVAVAALAAVLLSACSDPKSASGFRLPDGDTTLGREAFVRLNCHRCHTVSGETFAEGPAGGVIVVPLGGEVVRVRTYGQLVTSIINPQHIVRPEYVGKYTDSTGRSLMPDYNKTITVEEVINLVAFLQSHYRLQLPEPAYSPGM